MATIINAATPNTSAGPATSTVALNTTGGSGTCFLGFVMSRSPNITPSDTFGNTWTPLIAEQTVTLDSIDYFCRVWICVGGTGGNNHQFTATNDASGALDFITAHFIELVGDVVGLDEVSDWVVDDAADYESDVLDPSAPNALIFAFNQIFSTTAGSSFTHGDDGFADVASAYLNGVNGPVGEIRYQFGGAPDSYQTIITATNPSPRDVGAFLFSIELASSVELSVGDCAHGHAADGMALTQANTLAVADALHGHAADNLALVQSFTLSVAEAVHAHSVDAPTLTQANVLAVGDASHAHEVDSPSLVQAHVLAVAEALHGHSVDNLALTQANTLSADDASHGHAVDSVTVSTANTLNPAGSTHGHSADNVSLTQAHILAIQDALHAHGVDNVDLSFAAFLAVSDAAHAHTADSPSLVQANTLAVQDASHGHAVEAVALSQGSTLVVADGLHLHAVDSVTLTQAHILAVQQALHAHLADSVSLTQAGTLTVADALHSHLADAVVLVLPGLRPKNVVLVPAQDRRVLVAGGSRTVTVH